MRARSNRPEYTDRRRLLDLREDGEMVVVAGKAGVVREVFGRIDAGEGAEIMNKMGLIEIAAIESDIRPANGTA
jgi:hypothetical protein